MHHVLLNLAKSILIAMGLYAIFSSWIVAILASIMVEGFLSTKIWYLSGIWYTIFEYFYLGEITQYGWWVLGLSVAVILISILELRLMRR